MYKPINVKFINFINVSAKNFNLNAAVEMLRNVSFLMWNSLYSKN